MAILKRKYTYLFVITSLVLLLSLVGLAGCKTTQTHTLTTNASPSGAGSVSPSGGDYDSGASVTLTASPASGYTFAYWSGSASGTNPTTTITMDSDKSITANFEAALNGSAALFSDDFSQDTGAWDIFSTADGEAFFENGWLHVISYTAAGHPTASHANQNFTDFILEVDMELIAGTTDNWQSVVFRYGDAGNYYSAEISADGYYEMQLWVGETLHTLVRPTTSSHIHQGQGAVNSVRIECVGNRLSLSVNGHLLAEVFDDTLTSGNIALEVDSLGGTFSEVAFDNLVVTEP
jgi:uncharacterized repeat protein (TIGR02543 family)